MSGRARWFAVVAALGIALAGCAPREPDAASQPLVALGERGVELPAGGVAAIAVSVARSVDGPISLTFDPLASSASIRGILRPAPGGAVLTIATSRGLSPGVYDALVVARGGEQRNIAPLQIHVLGSSVLLPRERRPVQVSELGYEAVVRSRPR